MNDRGVLNGVFWVLRSGAPWRDLPDNFGPYTTRYNLPRSLAMGWRLGQMMASPAAAHDAAVQMINTSIMRVHHIQLHTQKNDSQEAYNDNRRRPSDAETQQHK